MAGYIYKPQTRKGPVFLSPTQGSGPPQIKLPSGQIVTAVRADQAGGSFFGHEGYQYVFPNDVLGQQGAVLMFDGQTQSLGNTNMAYRGTQFGSLGESSNGAIGDPNSMMGGMGGMGNPFMMNFNPINYQPIKYKPFKTDPIAPIAPINIGGIETAPYNFTDPIAAANRYNQFNTGQEEQAYQTGIQRGTELTNLDMQSIGNFAQNMSGLQQNLVAGENAFNQAQRLQAVDFAMPDLRSTLDRKRGRAETYASGRLLSSAEDRAYELAAKSASADSSAVRGFGDDSVFGRRTSDILSAQQRLGISQMGEGMLNDWITQGSSILIDQPLKSSISQRLPSTPPILPSQQAAQQQNNLTNLTTVPLQFGISSEINQNQFSTNLEQGTRQFNKGNEIQVSEFNKGNEIQLAEFNKSNEIQVGEFNTGNRLNTQQFNAGNTLAKDQFNASGQFQASVAQFNGLTSNYQLATTAANRVEDLARQDAHNEAASVAAGQNISAQQSAANTQAIGQIGGAIVGAASSYLGSGSSGSSSPGQVSGGGQYYGDVNFQDPNAGQGFSMNPGGASIAPTGGQSLDAISGDSGGGGGSSFDYGGGSGGGYSPGSYSSPEVTEFTSGGYTPETSYSKVGSPEKLTKGGGALDYNGSAIPVSSGPYDGVASASDISKGMQQTGQIIQNLGQSGPSTPQMASLGARMTSGGQAANDITSSFQMASTPEAHMALASELQNAATKNATTPEQQASVQEIFSQVREHLDTGVGITGQPAGIAGFIKNYDKYSGPERARGVTNISFAGQDMLSEYGIKDLSGASLAKIAVPGTKNKMTVQDAISLNNAGYNVSGLVKNWDDIETVNESLGSKSNLLHVASTGRDLGLIGHDTPESVNQRSLALKEIGANSAGAWGAGAVAVPANNKADVQKQGYVPLGKTTDGQVIAIPAVLAASAGLSQGIIGSGIDPATLSKNMDSSKVLQIGQKAAANYQNWSTATIPKDATKLGESSSVAAGLYKLGATDPYKLGAVLLNNHQKNASVSRLDNFTTPQARQTVESAKQDGTFDVAVSTSQAVVNTMAKLDPKGDAAGAAPYVNAAAAGKQLYEVFNNPNATEKQKAEAVANAGRAGVNVAATMGSETAQGAVPYVNYAMAAYNASKVLSSDMSGEQKATALRRTAEDTVAAYYTLGLSSLAQFADQQFLGGTLNKLRGKIDKLDPTKIIGDKVLGKALGSFGGGKNEGQEQRDRLRQGILSTGVADSNFDITLADGTTKFNIGVDGSRKRKWFDESQRRPDQQDVHTLGAYDVDYTRDLDAVTNLAGHALSVLQFGDSEDPYVSQMGNYYTNAAVSNAGGDKLTMDGFGTAQANMKSMFTKAGIETKDEAYALSNQLKAEGRISDVNLVSIQQGINLAFDSNAFQGANQLLEGVKLGRKGESAPGVKEAAFATETKPSQMPDKVPAIVSETISAKPITATGPKINVAKPNVEKSKTKEAPTIANNPMEFKAQETMDIQTV